MKLQIGKPPTLAPITELPQVPTRLSRELCDLVGIPYLRDLVRAHLAERQEGAPALTFTIPASGERAPGLHVSHLGHTEYGGLCRRQLYLRQQGLDGPREAERQMGFERGHATEAWVMAILGQQMVKHGWRMERNLPCDYHHASGHVLTGELDGLFSGYVYDPPPFPGAPSQWTPTQFILDCKEVDDQALARLDAPRPSNVAQQQGYLASQIHNASFAVLAYVGRWSLPEFFYVPRNDIATHSRAAEVISLSALPEAPKAPLPKLTRAKNQGPDSIKLELPWQCLHCNLLDVHCDGALPMTARPKGVCGHVDGKGQVTLVREKFEQATDEEFSETEELVQRLMEVQ